MAILAVNGRNTGSSGGAAGTEGQCLGHGSAHPSGLSPLQGLWARLQASLPTHQGRPLPHHHQGTSHLEHGAGHQHASCLVVSPVNILFENV